jgi:hypothetical protein
MPVEAALPYRTDWREMTSVLDYCKGKGADRPALEARFGAGEALRETLNALDALRLIERGDGGDVRLTALGRQLAYAPDATQTRERLIEAVLGYPPYRFPLERALADGAQVLDGPWVEHIWQVDMRLGQPRNRVEEARTCFFRLADEAGLGTYRRGVRGQTTRLELAPRFAALLRPALERLDGERAAPDAAPAQLPQVAAGPSAPVEHERPTPVATRPADPPAATPATSARLAAPASPIAPDVMPGTALPGLPAGISVQVDMSDWELDKIADFLRLIGYLPPRGA